MEYAGRLSNGTRVMGILPAQALATSVVINKEYYWEVPRDWSLAEAATVPVVYTTAYYALVMRGQIRKGDKVRNLLIEKLTILPSFKLSSSNYRSSFMVVLEVSVKRQLL